MTLPYVAARRRLASGIPSTAPYNVPTHLTTPTYDGSGQPVHLDVIDFHEEIGDMWNGWRYWMVLTPYPASMDRFENPSLLVSNDAHNWQVPPGLTNPLYLPDPGSPYNSDPDIVYDPATDEIVLFYRDYKTLKTARSSDGITWPATADTVDVGDGTALSPSFLKDTSTGTWHRWNRIYHATAPASSGPYTAPAGYTGLLLPWHLNVRFAPGGGYHMLYHSNNPVHRILTASSADGNTWTSNPDPVLTVGTHDWSGSALYRSAFTLNEAGTRYRVWYCGASTVGAVWHVGYTEIPLTEWPTIT